MKHINIAKLLKKAPKGYKLYSQSMGEVYLDNVTDDEITVYYTTNAWGKTTTHYKHFTKYGQPTNIAKYNKEVTLFPDKEHLTWKGFKLGAAIFAQILEIEGKWNNIMEQKINIAELLKDAPKDTKLYSPLFGEVLFSEVMRGKIYCTVGLIFQQWENNIFFNKEGHLALQPYFDDRSIFSEEAMLFPSKDCRTWENFSAPWKHKHFEPYEKVLVLSNDEPHKYHWVAEIYSHFSENVHVTITGSYYSDSRILPYEGNEGKLGKLAE